MEEQPVPKTQKCIAVLWPSFLVAIVVTGLFFSAFDPDRLGIYSIGFLCFWLISTISGVGTLYFAMTNCMRQGTGKQD